MSATIPVRTVGGQVLMVPPMRLDWASSRPRLLELMDVITDMILGRWAGPEKERLGILAEFLAEVAKAADYQGPELVADVGDLKAIHAALRSIPPDPIAAEPAD